MYKIIFTIFTLFAIACSKNSINVKYNGLPPSDSLIVTINLQTVVRLSPLNRGLDTTIYYSTEKLATGHDVVIYATLFDKGKPVDSFFSFNDLGFLPRQMNFLVNDSMQLKYSYKNSY